MLTSKRAKYFHLIKSVGVIVICLSLFLKCSDPIDSGDSQIKLQYLYTKWFNSYEEESLSGEIYRPAGYKEFSPSRYRRTYSFEADGKCKWLVLSPTDAHYEMSCYWSYDQKEKTISIRTDSGKEILRLKIIELTKDLLILDTQQISNL